jgi:hypothetical protein
MKIVVNKEANKVLERIKKKFVCSDSTAIILLGELSELFYRKLKKRD